VSALLAAEDVARSMAARTIAERVRQIGPAIPFGTLGRVRSEPRAPEKQNLPAFLERTYSERRRNRIGWHGVVRRRPRHQIRVQSLDVVIR
jgi:hypothetical protein